MEIERRGGQGQVAAWLGLGPRETGPAWWGGEWPEAWLGLSLTLMKNKIEQRKERKEREVQGKDLRMETIFPDSQKYARSKKNRKAMIERLNSNSFDLNSNDLNRK